MQQFNGGQENAKMLRSGIACNRPPRSVNSLSLSSHFRRPRSCSKFKAFPHKIPNFLVFQILYNFKKLAKFKKDCITENRDTHHLISSSHKFFLLCLLCILWLFVWAVSWGCACVSQKAAAAGKFRAVGEDFKKHKPQNIARAVV